MIVVMVQDAPGLNNWRDLGTRHSATYVVEVQELVDRMFRTIPTRAGRAIAGSSMGGFGAMNVALSNPWRFSVVESWLGFFDNLHESLRDDEPVISRLGLHAFLYGASEDPVAVPSEDPEFAAELRAAGARARGVIYPGGHSLEKIREHLDYGLLYAGRSLLTAERRAAREAARAALRAAGRRGGRSGPARGSPRRARFAQRVAQHLALAPHRHGAIAVGIDCHLGFAVLGPAGASCSVASKTTRLPTPRKPLAA